MPYIFFIFFGFKNVFLNGYLEVVNFIDFSIAVTDCSIVILRISGFALIALVSCSVVLVMMLGLSWRGGVVVTFVVNDLATNNHTGLMYIILFSNSLATPISQSINPNHLS